MENRFLFLSKNDVNKIVYCDYQLVIDAVYDAFCMIDRGTYIQPDKNSQVFDERYQNRINCMPATLLEEKVSGVKWVSVFPSNQEKSQDNVEAFTMLSEIRTGKLECILNATETTSLRTAAVGALAAKYLAKKDAASIGFIGAGEEAKAHLKLIKYILPNIKKCYISSRTKMRTNMFLNEMQKCISDLEFVNCFNDYESAVRDADIIVTAISSQEPVLKANWIKEGALYIHVAGIEDEFGVAKKADKIICDKWECVKHRSQTIVQMYRAGELSEKDIYADFSEIITGKKEGRIHNKEFIYFNSVGLAIEDILLNNRIYTKAVENKIGTWISK